PSLQNRRGAYIERRDLHVYIGATGKARRSSQSNGPKKKWRRIMMRILGLLLLISGVALAQAPPAQAPALKPIGTVDDLMVGVVWPLSDDLFYIATRDTPGTDEQWRLFQGKMLMLAES